MPIAKSQRLRVPSHYYLYSDPPDKNGDEALHFISPQRRLKLKGHAFREFVQHVVPLLDGTRSFDAIHAEVADLFNADDLAACFALLAEQGVLEDAAEWGLDEAAQELLRPQLNLLHDVSDTPSELQHRLAKSRVGVFGLTPPGVAMARALAASGIRALRCIDPEPVDVTDRYFSPEWADQVGRPRTEAFIRVYPCPLSTVEPVTERITDDTQMAEAIGGCDFVVNCMDQGNLSLMYRLNRVALRTATPWISTAAAGLEVIVGPAVHPGETPCFMCYRMRLLACTEDPETGYDFESFLDRRKTDDSSRRANFASGPALAGQLAAVEVLKALTGISEPATKGRVRVLDLRDLSSTSHIVLRKPWCPACAANQTVSPLAGSGLV
jgi:bacteriocin biosynthesis cyclodehydratase domain-containing protein